MKATTRRWFVYGVTVGIVFATAAYVVATSIAMSYR